MNDSTQLGQFSVGVYMHRFMTLRTHHIESSQLFREAFIHYIGTVLDLPNTERGEEPDPIFELALGNGGSPELFGPVWSSEAEVEFRHRVEDELKKAFIEPERVQGLVAGIALGEGISAGCAPHNGAWSSSRIYSLIHNGEPWFCEGVVDELEDRQDMAIPEPVRSLLVSMPICVLFNYETRISG